MPSSRGYRFSRFELDLIRGCLRDGDREIKLRPKAFVVLHHLVEHAGRLLSKDELMAVAWPDVHVSEHSLVQCIREIRRALDDDDQGCIKNLPGRGYLFAAPITPIERASPITTPRPRPIAREHGLFWVGIAVAMCLGVAIGALSVRWLDRAPWAAPQPQLAAVPDTPRGQPDSPSPVDRGNSRRHDHDTQIELAYWQSVQTNGDQRDFQSYLDQFPDGRFAALARNRLATLADAAARIEALERAGEARRQADTERAERQRILVAERQAAELQAARRRLEADRAATREARLDRVTAIAAAPTPPAPPPVPEATAPPPPPPQVVLDAPARAKIEGKWAGELGTWRFVFTIGDGQISGSLTCGNNIYRLRDAFAAGRALDVTANRVSAGGGFPTTIGVKGDFPTLRLHPLSAPPPSCDSSQPFELRPVSTG